MWDSVLVSITCTTYNQEDYIAKALDSFLMQKTNFRFEIIVHDDASTDKTVEIIKKYESEHPDMFVCIFQDDNQYRKGISSNEFVLPLVRGKYRAFCEGDDYWTDPLKLQKQVDYMEAHPECSMCVHAAKTISSVGLEQKNVVRPYRQNKACSTDDLLSWGEKMFPSASMLQRTEHLKQLPEFYLNAPVGDLAYEVYFSLCGYIYYFDEYMSVYRKNAKGSWTNRTYSSLDMQIQLSKRLKLMYMEADKFSCYNYHKSFIKAIAKYNLLIALNTGDYHAIREERKTIDRNFLRRTTQLGLRHPRLYRAFVSGRLHLRRLMLRNK